MYLEVMTPVASQGGKQLMPGLLADPKSPPLTRQVTSTLNEMKSGISASEECPTESKVATDMGRTLVTSRSLAKDLCPGHMPILGATLGHWQPPEFIRRCVAGG